MTVLGIGTDILRTARFREIIAKHPHRLIRLQQRILHPDEIVELKNANTDLILGKLSSSWAAKEALYKSLGVEQKQCRFNEWKKVWGEEFGYEMVSNTRRDDRVLVSLSHDSEYTIAYALRQKV